MSKTATIFPGTFIFISFAIAIGVELGCVVYLMQGWPTTGTRQLHELLTPLSYTWMTRIIPVGIALAWSRARWPKGALVIWPLIVVLQIWLATRLVIRIKA